MILRPDARLMIAESVFGGALPKLSLDATDLWEQMQVAVPEGPTAVFDQQTDVCQVGSVALALVLGARFVQFYPNSVSRQAGQAHALSTALEVVPKDVANWISRAIQRRGHQPFGSSAAAGEAFDKIITTVDRVAGRNAILGIPVRHASDHGTGDETGCGCDTRAGTDGGGKAGPCTGAKVRTGGRDCCHAVD